MIRTRFAPSPTGFLHVGSLRTALFAYLFAKKHEGKFLLRIEDTDRERFVEGGIKNSITSLTWAGLTIDEGVDLDASGRVIQKGDYGPYIQSERLALYTKYVQELIEKDGAYYCFCTKERLDELRKIQEINKQAPGYDGRCRHLTPEERERYLKKNDGYVIRLNMPKEGNTSWHDLVRGDVTFENRLLDDQVLIKSDGFPTYHFAVVVDDHLMEITHVIRAEEWLSSTPKHLVLYALFGWKPPQFAHLPLLVNEQKQKLSKRHGNVSVEDFKEKGYLIEALVNFIALLGWNPGDERELFTLSELEKAFDFDNVSKSSAVFHVDKLNWYNKQYLMRLPLEEVTRRGVPFFVNAGLVENKESRIKSKEFAWLMRVVNLERGRVHTLKELVEEVRFVFRAELEYDSELLVWKKSTLENTKKVINELAIFLGLIEIGEWTKQTLEKKTIEWIGERGYDIGDVLWPMRVALSGKKNSPGPFEIAEVLGNEKTMERLQIASGKL